MPILYITLIQETDYTLTPNVSNIIWRVNDQLGLTPSSVLDQTFFYLIGPSNPSIQQFPDLDTALAYFSLQTTFPDAVFAEANSITSNYFDSYVVTPIFDAAVVAALSLKQDESAILASIAATSVSSGSIFYGTAANTLGTVSSTLYGRGLLNSASAAALKTALSISATDVSGLATVATSGKASDLTNDSGFITTSALSGYLTSSTASSTYVPQTTTVNGHALTGNVTISQSDISGLTTALAGKQATITTGSSSQYLKGDLTLGTLPTTTFYAGTMIKANPVFYAASGIVASGVIAFNLTTDGTSGGASIFPNGINTDSINLIVNDATAAYQMSYSLTNSNKTLTVTANKLTTANILSGILGQSAANGAVVKLTCAGN